MSRKNYGYSLTHSLRIMSGRREGGRRTYGDLDVLHHERTKRAKSKPKPSLLCVGNISRDGQEGDRPTDPPVLQTSDVQRLAKFQSSL